MGEDKARRKTKWSKNATETHPYGEMRHKQGQVHDRPDHRAEDNKMIRFVTYYTVEINLEDV